MGFWPELPKGSRVEEYEVAGGQRISSYLIPLRIETQIITSDRASKVVKAIPVIMKEEKEVVLSDQLISAHDIVLENVGKGLWKFSNERKSRKSESPEYW